MGPDNGTSPDNGLQVQAYAQVEVDPSLDQDHGLNVSQEVVTWVTRRFTVNEEFTYSVEALLSGFSDFFTWVDDDDPYFHFSENTACRLLQSSALLYRS